jgi:hypothetical protein
MVKYLWTICNLANSIWSSWISTYLLCGRSIWEITYPEKLFLELERDS